MATLLKEQTENGNGSAITVNPIMGFPDRLVWTEGSFASSTTASLQVKPSGASNWVTEKSFTEDGNAVLAVTGTMQVRGNVASAAASTSIAMYISEL